MSRDITCRSEANDCNVIILAGGRSSRMNFPKAWLPFSKDLSILEHIVNGYASIGCKQITVVLNEWYVKGFNSTLKKIEKKANVVLNKFAEKGRIYSLQLGIKAMQRNGMTFIHNVDNPDVNQSTLESLLEAKPNGYARPVHSTSGGHPILVTNGVLENILLSEEDVILRDLLSEHSRDDVPVDDSTVLLNINTPDEYRAHFGMDVPGLKGKSYASLA